MAKILIVEDDKTLNKAYELILRREGYDTRSAFNGKEALELTEEFHPDLILLDLLMPEMGGLEFLRIYDQPKKHPEVKVVIFSNMENPPEIEEAHQLGAFKFIIKAWSSPQNLARVVQNALQSKDE